MQRALVSPKSYKCVSMIPRSCRKNKIILRKRTNILRLLLKVLRSDAIINALFDKRWIAKVTSSLHDLLPVSQQSCKTKFRESSVTPESRKLILQTLLKPEFTLTKDLNIASGYVSMNIDRTPTVKMGMPNGGRSCFAKFAKVTSTSGFGYIPNGGSWFFTS